MVVDVVRKKSDAHQKSATPHVRLAPSASATVSIERRYRSVVPYS
jgi:hypothetical protein